MSEAFQPDGFQLDAFQTEGGPPPTPGPAFQLSAFQPTPAFQTAEPGPPVPVFTERGPGMRTTGVEGAWLDPGGAAGPGRGTQWRGTWFGERPHRVYAIQPDRKANVSGWLDPLRQ